MVRRWDHALLFSRVISSIIFFLFFLIRYIGLLINFLGPLLSHNVILEFSHGSGTKKETKNYSGEVKETAQAVSVATPNFGRDSERMVAEESYIGL